MIDAVFLGTGGMMPLPNRWLSSLLIRVNGHLTLFDCGEGTQIAWRNRVGLPAPRSNLHLAHACGPYCGVAGTCTRSRMPVERSQSAYSDPRVRRRRERASRDCAVLSCRSSGNRAGGERFATVVCSVPANRGPRLPVLAYRVDLVRGRAFLPDRARALGVPIDLWSQLQLVSPSLGMVGCDS